MAKKVEWPSPEQAMFIAMKIKNIALAISIISFAVGFSDYQENLLVWLGRPTGAIFAIVYFIFVLLEKQFAEFDKEHAPAAKASVKVSQNQKDPSALSTALS